VIDAQANAQQNNLNVLQADAQPNDIPPQPKKYIWSNEWIQFYLSPILCEFLTQWHGCEVDNMCFYLDKSSFIISGIVDFSEELEHQMKSENVIIGGCSFQFNPRNCNPLDYEPLRVWKIENSHQKIIEYPEERSKRSAYGAASGIIEKGIMPLLQALAGSQLDVNNFIQSAMPVITAIKDLYLEVSKAMKEKKEKRLMIKTLIFKLGMEMFKIFGKTCNILIHKYTASHNFTADLYGVLYEETFFIDPKTPFKLIVFREGSMSIPKECRKEHHWFAYGRDNTFQLSSFWGSFLIPSGKLLSFQRQGKVLSKKLLQAARAKAKYYIDSTFNVKKEAENPEKSDAPNSDLQLKKEAEIPEKANVSYYTSELRKQGENPENMSTQYFTSGYRKEAENL